MLSIVLNPLGHVVPREEMKITLPWYRRPSRALPPLNPLSLPLNSCCSYACDIVWFLSPPHSWNCSRKQPGTSSPGRDLPWVSFPETRRVTVTHSLPELLVWLLGFCFEQSILQSSWRIFLCQGCQVPGLVTQCLLMFLPPPSLTPPLQPARPCFSSSLTSHPSSCSHHPSDYRRDGQSPGPQSLVSQFVLLIPTRLAFHQMLVLILFSFSVLT